MNYKIISMDFDGTLLTSDKQVTEETRETLIELKEKDYIIIGITARILPSVKNVCDIGMFDYLILNNGNSLYDVKNKIGIEMGGLEEKSIIKITNYFKDISEEITESFSKSSLSHILAISGTHITYIILGITFMLTKSRIPRKARNFITILALLLFILITGFSPSVVRACIMGILMVLAKIVHKKSDILNSIAISLIIILIYI